MFICIGVLIMLLSVATTWWSVIALVVGIGLLEGGFLPLFGKIATQLCGLEGHSLEGRAMRVLKISKDDNRTKPAVFMDAGIHAREWLGPPTVLHVVYQLTALAVENQDFLDLADWYILPVANPDGYVYTWTVNRTWRKNRRNNTREDCRGVDINRNFDIHWGQECMT
ncbi:hypothetical protein B566_EDAN017340 [Ephemera danica]|nr:hypothetical protein B566_EDAN017340 [Ephemera danica]